MHGVHPGTTLGRYTLTGPVGDPATTGRWVAHDTDLERDVVLLVLASDGPHTDAALDAARRASGIGHPGLTRILDVDDDGQRAWITESHRADDQPLTELIGSGLPAEEVRRITGEVALVLEAARSRGLHHLALSPDNVLVGADGTVRVRGLAVDAALEGVDEEGAEADALDATGVVALAYAGLTGTWPLGDGTSLSPAPRDATGVVPPSHLAVGVPSDLDTICRETLADDAGPSSPGDYAASIAPWSRTPVDPEPEPRHDHRAADDHPAEATTDAVAAAHPADLDTDDEPTTVIPSLQQTAPEDETQVIPGTDPDEDPETSKTRPGKTAVAAAGATAATVAGAIAGGSKVLGERVGRAAHLARERAEVAAADRRAQREAIRTSESRDRVSLGSAGTADDLEAPAPLLPAETGQAPTQEQSRLVLGVMAGFVTLSLILGCFGVSRIGDNTDLGGIFGSDTQQQPVRTTEPPAGGQDQQPTDQSLGETIQVLSAIGYDPAGDGAEHNSEAQRVYDNDISTSWTTEGYQAPNFGNKPGVGIVLDLGQTQQVRQATLQLPTATTVQVFVGDQPGVEGTELGKSEGRNGSVDITGSQPARGQYVTIWFTTTTQTSDGAHRASLAEVVLR